MFLYIKKNWSKKGYVKTKKKLYIYEITFEIFLEYFDAVCTFTLNSPGLISVDL